MLFMRKILLFFILGLAPVLAFSQISEQEMIRKLDSLEATVDRNDPDYEVKMRKNQEDFYSKFLNANQSEDTLTFLGAYESEQAKGAMEMALFDETGNYQTALEFAGYMPVITINLKDNDSVFNINNLGSFTSMKILIIRGDMNTFSIDMDNIISKIEDRELEELYITNCKGGFSVIPENIALLKSLRVLGLFGNSIKHVPQSIGELTKLETLYLDANPITALPDNLSNLKRLNTLGVASTGISRTVINNFKKKNPQIRILDK